ncbi:DeoR family transcriptional regulator [Ignicoccus hospitalis]|nr:DeoR family transcriptional regulator [Ignicoccus hospitalis]HIH91131.1 GntR family transcriptional regulator [Desulfurococcaceae archaeon]
MVFPFRKKKERRLKDKYFERLYEAFEWGERLAKYVHSLEREREELAEEYREARRKGDFEKAKLLEQNIEDINNKIMKLKKLLKIIETERKRLEREGEYVDAIASMSKIESALRSNLWLLSEALRPQAELVLNRMEETLSTSRKAALPDVDTDFIYKNYVNEENPRVSGVAEEAVPEPSPVLLVDGMVAKYDFEEVVEKVYKVIETYVKFGYSNKLSVRKIAQHVGVSEQEVRKALSELEKRGKIKIRRSSS